MQMNKRLAATWITIVGCVIFLTACQQKAERSTQLPNYKVETLFTHEGCTVYRFDDGRTVYYTNCQGSTQSSCGKNCEQTVDTKVEEPGVPE